MKAVNEEQQDVEWTTRREPAPPVTPEHAEKDPRPALVVEGDDRLVEEGYGHGV